MQQKSTPKSAKAFLFAFFVSSWSSFGEVASAMKIIFYQANFCAECGNAMKPRFSWGPRYFCDECAGQMGRGSHLKSILALLFGTTLIVTALNRTEPPASIHSSTAPPPESFVSARDATAMQTPVLKSEPATGRVQCGARTKKGTPCKHLALPGQRCAQHRGMPSLLQYGERQRPGLR